MGKTDISEGSYLLVAIEVVIERRILGLPRWRRDL
jgi:hypothetical protein